VGANKRPPKQRKQGCQLGIEVQHSGAMPTITAAISLLLAQRQAQQQAEQQAQQGGLQDALSQLAPILAARQAAQQPEQPPSYASPGSLPYAQPSPDQPRYVRPTVVQQPADHSSSALRGLLNGQQVDDRLNNQDVLAQFKASQADQRLGERSQQQTDIEQLRDADMRTRAAQHDLPLSVVQGLQSGHMVYSPIQRDQLTKFDTWDAQIDASPQWSFTDKARAHADIAMKRHQVLASPTLLSPDKWPITPQQQADQSSWTVDDPKSGLTLRYHAGGVRNGVQMPPKLDELSAAHLKDWNDQQGANRKHQQSADNAATKQHAQGFRENEADARHQAAFIAEQRSRALDKLGPAPNPKSFTKLGGRFDQGAYDAAMKDWQSQRDTIDQQFSVNDQFAPFIEKQARKLSDIGAATQGLSMLPLPGAPQVTGVSYSDSSQPVDQQGAGNAGEQQLPPPVNPPGIDDGTSAAGQGQPAPSQQPVPVASPEDITAKLQAGELNINDLVNTPLGPRPLTQDVYNKLMGIGDGLD
jgi:hypothetical protein